MRIHIVILSMFLATPGSVLGQVEATAASRLPTAGQAVDSAAFVQTILNDRSKWGSRESRAAFRMQYDSAGRFVVARLIESNLARPVRDSLVAMIARFSRPQDRSDGRPALRFFRLQVVITDVVTLSTEESQHEPPRLANERMIMQELTKGAQERGLTGALKVNVSVNTRGRVDQTVISERSLTMEFDAFIAEISKKMRFSPARIDGIPTPVWVVIPVVTSFR